MKIQTVSASFALQNILYYYYYFVFCFPVFIAYFCTHSFTTNSHSSSSFAFPKLLELKYPGLRKRKLYVGRNRLCHMQVACLGESLNIY